MTANVLIREATEQDVPVIVALGMELMDYHKALDPIFSRKADADKAFAEFVSENICSEDACVVVAQVGSEIVGYCQVRASKYPPVLKVGKFGELNNCFVRKDMRSKGIARKLVGRIREWCRSKGLSRIEVRHSTKNPDAGHFWMQLGFEPYLRTLYIEP